MSILLHYSYKKPNKVVAKGHFKQQNSTCVWSLALFSICCKKNVTIDEKTPQQKFSWANSVIINIFYFIFIKCMTDVHIESLDLIGYFSISCMANMHIICIYMSISYMLFY